MNEKNLPVKIIIPQERDIAKNKGRGKIRYFRTITQQFVDNITDKFVRVSEFYNDIFNENKYLPVVGKIILLEDAIAKSHRPNDLCQDLNIIGAGDLQELYIKITRQGIRKTIGRINSPKRSQKLEANLTTIEDILPIYAEEKLSSNLKRILMQKEMAYVRKIKIKCFDFGNEYDNIIIRQYVENKIKSLGYNFEYKIFGEHLNFFKLENVKLSDLDTLSRINGIKLIDIFTEYVVPSDNNKSRSNFFNEDEDVAVSDTIIGIIDSGISEKSILNKYVIDRKEFIAKSYQNRSHGTFVASCLQYGSTLDNILEANKRYFKLLDIVALPNSDPQYGLTDTLSQDDFYDIVEEVMDQYSGGVKIWNISLGTSNIVEDDQVSDMGAFFDYIQDKYNVQLIISCGNYGECQKDVLRSWPPQNLGENDRITVPADSLRSISVGSIALRESEDSLVRKNEPSPFSRRGPGSNYIIKPDVVDYGGNISVKGSYKNLDVAGLSIEDEIISGIGTSYSTPKITYKYAKIFDDLFQNNLLLAKAFLIHNAKINSKKFGIENGNIHYYGFGYPSYNTNEILRCSDNEITLVFNQTVTRGTHLEMFDFPFPKCLIKNGKYTGEIFMTLAYNPPLNQNYGSQYCRTNIDVSYGTYCDIGGKNKFEGRVPLETGWADKYESSRVKKGFKWSPVKSYYRNLKNGIKVCDGWKIRIDMVERDDLIPMQEFVLIVTIRGNKDDQVYNDMVLGLQNQGIITANLETQYQTREKVK